MSTRKVTADEAYAKAMQVLEDLQVTMTTAGAVFDPEHTQGRIQLAEAFTNLGDSIGLSAPLED